MLPLSRHRRGRRTGFKQRAYPESTKPSSPHKLSPSFREGSGCSAVWDPHVAEMLRPHNRHQLNDHLPRAPWLGLDGS